MAQQSILKSYLRLLGYRVRGWGLGRNSGDVRELLPRVLKRIGSFARRTEQEVRLIGWSLGGYLAREAARERPDLVHRVITLGTPVIGGPKYTVVARQFVRRGMDMAAIEAEIELRNQISLRTPVTAIYSRADAVVAWEACIDHNGVDVEHVEVRATHLGLGFSAEVYKIIAQRLAEEGGTCRQTHCRRVAAETRCKLWQSAIASIFKSSPPMTAWNQILSTGRSRYFSSSSA